MTQIKTKIKGMEQLEKKELIKLLGAVETRYSILLTQYKKLEISYLNTIEIYRISEQNYQNLEKELSK